MSVKVEKAMQMHIDTLQDFLKDAIKTIDEQKKEIALLREQLERRQKMEH